MRLNIIWELIKINVLYANKQVTKQVQLSNQKKLIKTNRAKSTFWGVVINQTIMLIIFAFIYGFLFLLFDFKKYPGMFSLYLTIFFIMALVSSFSALYNILYESSDLKMYAPLPITQNEVYIAKILSGISFGLIYLSPLAALFFITFKQFHGFIFAIPFAIIMLLILVIVNFVCSIYLVSFIGKIIIKSKHRKIISSILMFIVNGFSVLLIISINYFNKVDNKTLELKDAFNIPFARGIYDLINNPFSVESLLNFWLVLIVIMVLIYGIIKWIIPMYYKDALFISTKQTSSLKKHRDLGLKMTMIKHHLKTIQNSTLLSQTYVSPIIILISFSGIGIKSLDLINLYSWKCFGVIFFVGFCLAYIFTSQTTIIGVGISLERYNYNFVKTLPLNLKSFLQEKFKVLIIVQLLPIILFLIVAGLYFKLNIFLILSLILGIIYGGIIHGEYVYKEDYNNLILDWQDVTQLFNRNANHFKSFISMMAVVVLLAVLTFTGFALFMVVSPIYVSLGYFIGVLFIGLFFHLRVNKKFWKVI